MKLRNMVLAIPVLLAVVVACSSGTDTVDEASSDGPVVEAPLLANEFALIKGPVSPDGMQAIFGTSDLGVGANRIGFVLTSSEGLQRAPAVSVSSRFFPDGDSEGEVKQTALAVFRPWPYGTRGLYTTTLDFDAPGRWGLDIVVLGAAGGGPVELSFDVRESPMAPAVGAAAIRSDSKTVADVLSSDELTTGSMYDEDLYQLTIADAVVNGLPSVVVMASPAFCTNAVCGPQVEVLQELKDIYGDRANFIHVDIYDNPDEIQGDLDRAIISPTAIEWNLPSTEWSFVIDSAGVVAARFESFATIDELEEALKRVL